MKTTPFTEKLIAPCGMNCSTCRAHLRKNNPCPGCRFANQCKPKTRTQCGLKVCGKRDGKFCFDCAEFPCALLKRMDHRYRTRYGMSVIENLLSLKKMGMKKYLEAERKKWISEKGILCVHDKRWYPSNGIKKNKR